MLNPIVAFFERIFRAIGHGLGLAAAGLLWPFLAAHGWYRRRAWTIQLPIAAFVALLVVLYAYFIWQTQSWRDFDPNYVDRFKLGERQAEVCVDMQPLP